MNQNSTCTRAAGRPATLGVSGVRRAGLGDQRHLGHVGSGRRSARTSMQRWARLSLGRARIYGMSGRKAEETSGNGDESALVVSPGHVGTFWRVLFVATIGALVVLSAVSVANGWWYRAAVLLALAAYASAATPVCSPRGRCRRRPSTERALDLVGSMVGRQDRRSTNLRPALLVQRLVRHDRRRRALRRAKAQTARHSTPEKRR